ncbi:type II toxin-antitoxin system MqsA family antitoxin [Pseudomonas sp. WS 5532]|uniref:type II toxin-antitoxin system MqsA family antitoxin n=1 Tax=unclassified Pseudomonas TaxID=196821 RepID=UPI001475397A|nr:MULTISPECIES: type II toxin-antitoxin system MqsA family antitoxin [unclassified Pseudomonas]NMX72801.1 type II toxin-antitoxin system MqsA family antitoxin [Pseudomonas sp. WS 5532]NMX74307.1 type II toxin-antitoxin system MqsA family antitoxin [Pseudomonas sp. WS 5532]
MKCHICGGADLVVDTRDLPHTYKGETTVIAGVHGSFCPACGEAILDAAESQRVSVAMVVFNKSVAKSGTC